VTFVAAGYRPRRGAASSKGSSECSSEGTFVTSNEPLLRSVTVNGVELAYFGIGDHGPLALCLHGFPDSAHTWRHLIPRLVARGYRVVAPFMRGYAPSGVPADGRYQTAVLALDAIALHDALGGDHDAVIIGHDWGASATHGAAAHEPDRWRKVVTMAVPPGGALGAALLGDIDQLRRSWYMFFFQHGLADVVVPAGDSAFIDRLWADWSPGYEAAEDLAHAKDALRDPANLTAALGYYRATLGDGLRDPALDDLQAAVSAVPPQPLLYLHGADDGCVEREVAESARTTVGDNVTIEIVDGAGHFLHLERPDVVGERVLEFLG
jgi:pimeloyl-ACP methyl ester carboxylesterase